MDRRQQLENLTYAQLKDLLKKYGLSVAKTRAACTDSMMDFLEKNPSVILEDSIRVILTQDTTPVFDMSQLCTMMQTMMSQQKDQQERMDERMIRLVESQERSDRIIQTFLAESATNRRPSSPQDQSVLSTSQSSQVNQVSAPRRDNDHPVSTNISPAQAVQLLSSQIPSFGGTEDEDVKVWIRRVEVTADIHEVSSKIIYLAATSKLTKLVRKWFDSCPETVLQSWQTFKQAVQQRFERRILWQAIIHKVENREWNYNKESFHEYATDKITLMQSLNLEDQDIIQYLITGIQNRALRSTASVIKVSTVNEFLQEMHRVALCFNELPRKSPTQDE